MEEQDFKDELVEKMNKIDIDITKEQVEDFYLYMKLLLEWNEKINLTAITDPKEIIIKHFVDCATILKHVKTGEKIIDIGTGAGFPGIPLKILNRQLEMVLVDSLNKRIHFLEEVINQLKLEKIQIIHARAEELARDKKHREQYDVSISRAVAPLNVLLEYTVPFIKVKGRCICMKGSNIQEEINSSKKAFLVFGIETKKLDQFTIPNTEIRRSIIVLKKTKKTEKEYPRKAGTPKNRPIC